MTQSPITAREQDRQFWADVCVLTPFAMDSMETEKLSAIRARLRLQISTIEAQLAEMPRGVDLQWRKAAIVANKLRVRKVSEIGAVLARRQRQIDATPVGQKKSVLLVHPGVDGRQNILVMADLLDALDGCDLSDCPISESVMAELRYKVGKFREQLAAGMVEIRRVESVL